MGFLKAPSLINQSLRTVNARAGKKTPTYVRLHADSQVFTAWIIGSKMAVRWTLHRSHFPVVEGEGTCWVGGHDLVLAFSSLDFAGGKAKLNFDPAPELRDGSGLAMPIAAADKKAERAAENFADCDAAEDFFFMPLGAFLGLLNRVLYAYSDEEYRSSMRGVKFEVVEGRLRLVASDGYRLALTCQGDRLNMGLHEGASPVALGKELEAMVKILERFPLPSTVYFKVSSDHLGLEIGGEGWKFEGFVGCGFGYPDYHRAIPKEQSFAFSIDRKAFFEAIRPILPFAKSRKETSSVELTFDPSPTVALNDENAPIKLSFPILEMQGKPFPLLFNARYLIEALDHAPYETANVIVWREESAVRIESGTYLAVIVPLRRR
uniref:Beta clamp domain protein n=1 Tax=Hot spring virus BHS2 TaxID=2024352 RepID=A0A2U7NW25_9VIRU|nr:beta clamp domain protein [Hot spring virus BHS2]